MKGLDLCRDFSFEIVLPAIARALPGIETRVASGLLGMGSECFGGDDEVSHDHHWGPRLNVILTEADYQRCGRQLQSRLLEVLPKEFRGYPIEQFDACGYGVFVESVNHFCERLCGYAEPPANEREWLNIAEEDLFKVTTGEVFHDPCGELTKRRQALNYYPDTVWRKRIFDWSALFSQWANYNLHRILKRHDPVAFAIYTGLSLQKALELAFLMNRRYAPDKKWLYWHFCRLPELASAINPMVVQIVSAADGNTVFHLFGEIAGMLSDFMFERGILTRKVENRCHPAFGYRGLADALPQLRSSFPAEWIALPINQSGIWEGLFKDAVTLTLDEYFRMTGRGG